MVPQPVRATRRLAMSGLLWTWLACYVALRAGLALWRAVR